MIKKHQSPTDGTFRACIPVLDEVYRVRFELEEVACELIDSKKGHYKIISIPFITYGINKSDTVLLNDRGIVERIVKRGEEYGYRIAFAETAKHTDHEKNAEILNSLIGKNVSVEQDSVLLAAVSAKGASNARALEEKLIKLVEDGSIQGFDTIA